MKFLASGGYGKVYRAEWRGRMVAVKQLFLNFPESSNDLPVSDDSSNSPKPQKQTATMNDRLRTQIMEEQTRRFLLEAELLAHLRHKNILRLIGYTHFKREQTIAIVTEYISGGSLYDLLHRPHRYGFQSGPSWRPLSPRQEFSVSIGIAQGMEFLHSRNVCHRDLKSANVLLTKDCVCSEDIIISHIITVSHSTQPQIPQICDFGLAKWMEFSNRTTSAHGTVLWTAPELLLGRECSSKADVFSFAVVMYEIFVRHLPYESPHIATPVVIAQVAAGRLRPALPSDMEKSVSDLLTRCWKQNPEKRPSFNELIRELDKAYKAMRNS